MPQIVVNIIKQIRYMLQGGVKGKFKNFKEADKYLKDKGLGNYSNSGIEKNVYTAVNEVRNNRAEFERDGVLFFQKNYNYPVLANLLYTIAVIEKKHKYSNVLDFGGSLGSTFFQNRDKLSVFNCKWGIVEQNAFVNMGKQYIPEISFYDSVEEYALNHRCDICLLSGVIQYFDEPYKWVKRILDLNFQWIILDRMLFNIINLDRCAIQYVPSEIYNAQYPIWLLDKDKLVNYILSAGYELIESWESFDRTPVKMSFFKYEIFKGEGMLFSKRDVL